MPSPQKDQKNIIQKNPKTAALIAFVGAAFVLAVAFYPPLQPICESLGFCDPVPAAEVPAE